MRFISALMAGALAIVAAAQDGNLANPITNSDFTGIAAGTPITITWTPTTESTITLKLVRADGSTLDDVSVIQSGIENSGSYTWTPDASIPKGDGYALKIIDDADPETNYNYTKQFPIDSDTTSAAPTSESSTEAPSSTEEPSTSTTEEPSTTTEETTATEATSTDASTTEESTTDAATTTSAPTTTSGSSETTSSSQGAAPTGGAKVGAGLVGFVGAAMLLL
ncbi:hypothetical protein V494_05470 [Pseudogymnoascus sp. VKM F-4513 (FW-928)]|nr:hypothetical protein V494_05470 [Pseudogymnoascus sp. VKM F-4513 (FW-928)]